MEHTEPSQASVKLVSPAGEEGWIVTLSFALEHCEMFPGWSFRQLREEELNNLSYENT